MMGVWVWLLGCGFVGSISGAFDCHGHEWVLVADPNRRVKG